MPPRLSKRHPWVRPTLQTAPFICRRAGSLPPAASACTSCPSQPRTLFVFSQSCSTCSCAFSSLHQSICPSFRFLANATSDRDRATSRFTCHLRQPCVLRLFAAQYTTLSNQSLIQNTSFVSTNNGFTAASLHQLLLVRPGNPAVYDFVWPVLALAQQPRRCRHLR